MPSVEAGRAKGPRPLKSDSGRPQAGTLRCRILAANTDTSQLPTGRPNRYSRQYGGLSRQLLDAFSRTVD